MMMTDIEAMPPIIPKTVPSGVTSVLKKVELPSTPNLDRGHLEVSETAVAVKNAEVTRTIIIKVNRINKVKPGFPKVFLAISAMERPFSCKLAKRAEKSCTAPMKIPPNTIHSQAGTAPSIQTHQ